MMPIGPLMIEHRLIERMIAVMEMTMKEAEDKKEIDPRFIASFIRFIKDYADRCHHGKEEDILFQKLKEKAISQEHGKMLDELIQEHKFGRETTARLVEANAKYAKGETGNLSEIVDCIKLLVDFYPEHIKKEDKHFFLPVMEYFTEQEKDLLLKEGYEFDSSLLQEEYAEMVFNWEKGIEKDREK